MPRPASEMESEGSCASLLKTRRLPESSIRAVGAKRTEKFFEALGAIDALAGDTVTAFVGLVNPLTDRFAVPLLERVSI